MEQIAKWTLGTLVVICVVLIYTVGQQHRSIERLERLATLSHEILVAHQSKLDSLVVPTPVYVDTVITPSVKVWVVSGGVFVADSGQSALTINGADSTTLNYVLISDNHTFVGPVGDYREEILGAIKLSAKHPVSEED